MIELSLIYKSAEKYINASYLASCWGSKNCFVITTNAYICFPEFSPENV